MSLGVTLIRIYQAAFPRSEAIELLSSLTPRISRHLWKLHILPNHPAKPGWLDELNLWRDELVQVSNSSTGRNKLKRRTFVTYFWVYPFETDRDIDGLFRYLTNNDYEFDESNYDRKKLHMLAQCFIDSILNDSVFKDGSDFTNLL